MKSFKSTDQKHQKYFFYSKYRYDRSSIVRPEKVKQYKNNNSIYFLTASFILNYLFLISTTRIGTNRISNDHECTFGSIAKVGFAWQ